MESSKSVLKWKSVRWTDRSTDGQANWCNELLDYQQQTSIIQNEQILSLPSGILTLQLFYLDILCDISSNVWTSQWCPFTEISKSEKNITTILCACWPVEARFNTLKRTLRNFSGAFVVFDCDLNNIENRFLHLYFKEHFLLIKIQASISSNFCRSAVRSAQNWMDSFPQRHTHTHTHTYH